MSIYDKFGKARASVAPPKHDYFGRAKMHPDPDQTASFRENEIAEAKARAMEKVQGLIRVTRFKSYLQSGMTADQAAQVMGIKVDPLDRYNSAKIMKKVEDGKIK